MFLVTAPTSLKDLYWIFQNNHLLLVFWGRNHVCSRRKISQGVFNCIYLWTRIYNWGNTMQQSSWTISLRWLFCSWTCSVNVIEPRWPKVKKCPKMNKWEHCKSSSIVKWHLGFLIILTFRPFPPLPPLREPPLPNKTCKTTFFGKPFQTWYW